MSVDDLLLTDDDVPADDEGGDKGPAPLAPLDDRDLLDGIRPTVEELLVGLDDAQRAAVSTAAARALIVAGPGAGKTRVLTRRIAWLTGHDDVAAWRIMSITFTNKAAAEMRERVEDQLGAATLSDAWIGTFHSICARLLRRSGPVVGVPADFFVADSDDTRRILKRIIVGDGVEVRDATKIADDVARRISSAKNRLEDPAAHRDPIVARYAAAYRDALAKQRLVDFDDLLVGAVRLLHHPEEGPRIRGRFTHVLVDEYQDTNVAQWELLRALVGTDGSIFAVGDAQQSIYGFRGSTPAAMEQFRDDWPDAELHELGRNWRSTSRIVAVGDAFGAHTGVRNRASLWTTADAGEPVRAVRHRDDRDEARTVAAEVAAFGRPWAERAILVRTHATTRLIEAELTAAGIPYVVVGGTRFWDRAEVRDALAWIRLATNPDDVDAFRRAAGVPRRGLGEKAVETVVAAAAAEGVDVVTWIRLEGDTVPRAGKALAGFVDTLDAVIDASRLGPGPAVASVLEIPGFVDAACRAAGRADTAEDREANLDELRSAAESFTPEDPDQIDAAPPGDRGVLLTAAFCAQAALSSATDSDGDGVRLTTVHAAKGREFDDVWVIGVEEGLFPHSRAEGADEINEECRLLFVAATRARWRLTLSWAQSRMLGGKVVDCDPSPFLNLLDPLEAAGGVVVSGAPANRPTRPTDGAGRSWGGPPRRPRSTSTVGRPARRPAPSRSPGGSLLGPAPRTAPTPRPQPEGGYQPGQPVRHDAFGDGTVVSVSGDVVVVRFGQTTRSLAASLAPMTLVT